MLAILIFLLFNCAFSLSDVLTDLLSYFNLLDDGHVWWASLTMYWMWNAFVLHTLLYLWYKMRGKREVCCVEFLFVHYGINYDSCEKTCTVKVWFDPQRF